jgi:hypothetical protein
MSIHCRAPRARVEREVAMFKEINDKAGMRIP